MAWAALLIASLASFWSSSRKITNLWFPGLKTKFGKLSFSVTIVRNFTYYLLRTSRISTSFSRAGPILFSNVCNASSLMREWKYLILSTSVSWLWVLRLVWKRSSNNSNLPDLPTNVRIVVVNDFGNLEILWLLPLMFAEMLLFANCWST